MTYVSYRRQLDKTHAVLGEAVMVGDSHNGSSCQFTGNPMA